DCGSAAKIRQVEWALVSQFDRFHARFRQPVEQPSGPRNDHDGAPTAPIDVPSDVDEDTFGPAHAGRLDQVKDRSNAGARWSRRRVRCHVARYADHKTP